MVPSLASFDVHLSDAHLRANSKLNHNKNYTTTKSKLQAKIAILNRRGVEYSIATEALLCFTNHNKKEGKALKEHAELNISCLMHQFPSCSGSVLLPVLRWLKSGG